MSIMKLSQLIKTLQINNIPYIILKLISNKDLLILIFYVHMKFIVRQIKSTSIVIDLIENTLNTTPIAFTNSKYQKLQFYKVTKKLHNKMTLKITPEHLYFVYTMAYNFWHQIRYRYILGNDIEECVPNIYWFAELKNIYIY
jgi:hypothetical protein